MVEWISKEGDEETKTKKKKQKRKKDTGRRIPRKSLSNGFSNYEK